MNLKLIWYLSWMVILAGCSSISPNSYTIVTNDASIQQSTPTWGTQALAPTPENTNTPIPTPLLPTATLNKPETVTLSIPLESEISEDYTLDGFMVFVKLNVREGYLLDYNSYRKMSLICNTDTHPYWGSLVVSSDQERLACLEFTDPGYRLRVFAGNGSQILEFNLPTNHRSWNIPYWLDNNRITLQHNDPGTVYVYDLNSGELAEIPPTFPNTTEDGDLLPYDDLNNFSFVYYNPDLTQAVLVRYSMEKNKGNYESWDVTQQKSLWKIDFGSGYASGRVVWSQDGREMTLFYKPDTANKQSDGPNYGALYQVGLDGQVTRLIDQVRSGYAWSPDHRRMASWWGVDNWWKCPSEVYPLVIYDTADASSTVFCLIPDMQLKGGIISTSESPIWSPDGRYILINKEFEDETGEPDFPSEPNNNRVILIDTQEKRAFILLEGYAARGWMKLP